MLQTQKSDNRQANLLASFSIRGAHYAMDATGVQEVIRPGNRTRVYHAPEAVVGVVNLRGRIVTIIDVGLKLGFDKVVTGPDSRIFIVEDRGEVIGLLVDRAGEVLEVEGGSIEAPPANVAHEQRGFFKGVYRVNGLAVTLLEVSQILSSSAA